MSKSSASIKIVMASDSFIIPVWAYLLTKNLEVAFVLAELFRGNISDGPTTIASSRLYEVFKDRPKRLEDSLMVLSAYKYIGAFRLSWRDDETVVIDYELNFSELSHVLSGLERKDNSGTAPVQGTGVLFDEGEREENKPNNGMTNGVQDSGAGVRLFCRIPGDGIGEIPIHESMIHDYQLAYPSVNVRGELLRMRAWMLSNRNHLPTSRGLTRFVNRWLAREHDRMSIRQSQTTRNYSQPRIATSPPPIPVSKSEDFVFEHNLELDKKP